jgi:hypothetical protein
MIALDQAIVDATMRLARKRGLDAHAAKAHMLVTLAMLDSGRETFLRLEQERLKLWSNMSLRHT